MSSLLKLLQGFAKMFSSHQPTLKFSMESRVDARGLRPRLSRTQGQGSSKTAAVAAVGSANARPQAAHEACSGRGNESAPAAPHNASAFMISFSASKPPKWPRGKTKRAKARAAPAKSDASSVPFNILMYRYGPSEDQEDYFWAKFYKFKKSLGLSPGQREWEQFYPGSRLYEQVYKNTVNLYPPVGGCIYCPFKERSDRELLRLASLCRAAGFVEPATPLTNARCREDWEWRRLGAPSLGGEDPVPDWAGITACGTDRKKCKHDQLVAWGFRSEAGRGAERSVQEKAAPPPRSAATGSVRGWLKDVWSLGKSHTLQWMRSCAQVYSTGGEKQNPRVFSVILPLLLRWLLPSFLAL